MTNETSLLLPYTDEYGHGGPITVSPCYLAEDYKVTNELIAASEECGIPYNPSYNNGCNHGAFYSYNLQCKSLIIISNRQSL